MFLEPSGPETTSQNVPIARILFIPSQRFLDAGDGPVGVVYACGFGKTIERADEEVRIARGVRELPLKTEEVFQSSAERRWPNSFHFVHHPVTVLQGERRWLLVCSR